VRLRTPVGQSNLCTGFNGTGGTPNGFTDEEAVEAAPVPAALVAVTVNVYDTPFVRPVTVQLVAVVVVQTNPPGDALTV
jgi:hypothetical protein